MFGKKNNLSVKIKLSSYEDSHQLAKACTGRFNFVLLKDYIYTESVLGPVKLEVAPAILCKKCRAEFLAPQFSQWLEREISKKLILSNGILTKKQIKFLRLDFGFTQEELGERIGLRKEQLAKMESASYPDHMSPDKQFRLKFHLAKILGIEDLSKLHDVFESKEVLMSKVIPTKKEIENSYKPTKAA